jgi:predicted ATP-grasp superfamily ATP-dependent carboligase
VKSIKIPSRFFKTLEQLGIPHPATRLAPDLDVVDPAAWLVKDPRSEGGVGVSLASLHSRLPTADSYLQQRLEGEPHSLLFLANGTDIEPVGFNRLLFQGHFPGRPFLFSGAIFPGTLSAEHCSAVIRHTRALTRQLGLVGLNSVDFIRDRHGCHVLEINPRPSATLALHDRDYPLGLISAHIDACRGRLVPRPSLAQQPRGFRIVYAPQAVTVPDSFAWPNWASDRPGPGTRIPPHEPICSVSANGDVLADLERTLFQREQLIHEALML